MITQRNILTALGCSSTVALALSVATPALANATAPHQKSSGDATLLTQLQSDNNPILDAITCSCARCVMGQVAEQ